MNPAPTERPSRLPLLLLAASVYVPLLLTAPGRVGADTKTYLYLDPARLLSRAWSMWDPSVGLGTVSHQTIGYLWPMGPWFWAFDELGVPDWVAQRLWLGTILFAAGAGTLWLFRSVLGWRTAPATVAAFSYALTPYLLSLAARLSAILLPFAGLPWLLGLTVLALRRGGWRHPALFALAVTTVGSVNATALLLVGLAPVWWLLYARLTREATTGQVVRTAFRIGALTLVVNLWWIAGLWAQSGWGIDILRYTETAEVVASSSNGVEVLRGLGYWFFYGGDRLGPWIEPGAQYTQRIWLLALTYALPLAALLGALRVRYRYRGFFVGLLGLGVVLAVGAHPWDSPSAAGAALKEFLLTDAGLAMRSLPRAAPLVALATAAGLGAGVEAAAGWLGRRAGTAEVRLGRALPAVAVAAVYLALAPLWLGQLVADNLDRPEDIPSYWLEAADYLDSRDDGTRVLEVPGTDFASYRWGNTVDPITPGLIDRPYVARELIPLGSAESADLVSALDLRMQEGTLEPSTVAAVARLMGVGDVLLRDDLQFERYRTPRPYILSPQLAEQEGLDDPVGFGAPTVNRPIPRLPLLDELALARDDRQPRPPLEAFAVVDPEPIVRARAATGEVVLAADGNGLVDASSAGVLDGHALVRYGATLGGDAVAAALDEGATLVITDGNRLQGRRWSTVRDNLGMVEPPALLGDDLTDNRLPLFPDAEDGWQTTNVAGDVEVTGTSYGNQISFTPEYRPANAVDGDLSTEWRTGAGTDVRGELLRIEPEGGTTPQAIRFVQQLSGFQNRFIGEVEIRRDDLPPQRVVLDERSQTPEGQVVALDPPSDEPVETLTVEIVGDTTGLVPRWGRPVRYAAFTQVGFAEVELLEDPSTPTGQYTDGALELPPAATGSIDGSSDVAVVLTRWRVDPTDAVRRDPEPSLRRVWSQPVDRTFEPTVVTRLAGRADDVAIDRFLGVTGPEVQASSRLVGTPSVRGSAALDGDSATAWIPGFFDAQPVLTVTTPAPTTITELAPLLLDDDRNSRATSLRVEVDGEVVGSVAVPGDGSTVALPEPVSGTSFRFVVDGIDPVVAREWYGDVDVAVPVAIAELGAPELAVEVPARVDTGCRDDLLQLDGEPVPIRVEADTADLLQGQTATAEACDGALEIAEGEHRLESAAGHRTALDVDQVVLRSGFDGAAGASGSSGGGGAVPSVSVTADDGWRLDVRVEGATPGEPFWLVLGQSRSTGWRLGGAESTLVDGYANGWLVDPDSAAFDLELVWEPQRTVNRALLLSVLGTVGCLAIIGVSSLAARRRASVPAVAGPAAAPAPRPASNAWLGLVTAAATVGSLVVIGPLAALVVGAVTAAAAWGPRIVRRWAWLVPVAAYGVAVGYVLLRQVWAAPRAAFEWPAELATAHQPALVAVALTLSLVALQARPVADRPAS